MPPVILLATTVEWPFAARLAGGFAQMRVRVEAMAPNGHVLARSRYISAFHRYRPLAPEAALERAIRSARPDLLIPCDDRALAQALHVWRRAEARLDEEISSLIARSLGNPAVYSRLGARADFIADARAEGILAPEMHVVDSEDALDAALAALGLPAVLKADGSWGGDGVVIVRTRAEARDAWLRLSRTPSRARSLYRAIDRRDLHRVAEAMRPPRTRLGIQAYVEGVPATSTFAARKGKVLAALHFDVVVAPDSHGPASVVRRVEDPRMDLAVARIAQRYELSGLHGLDFMRDARGNPHLIEINPRATPTSHLALGERGDLPAALSASFFSSRLKPRPTSVGTETSTSEIALFPQEWLRDPKSAHLSSAYHDVPWDDPALLHALIGRQAVQTLAGERSQDAGNPGLAFPKPQFLQRE